MADEIIIFPIFDLSISPNIGFTFPPIFNALAVIAAIKINNTAINRPKKVNFISLKFGNKNNYF